MTKEQIIKVATDLGLKYTGDSDEDGRPEFIGTEKQWEKFNEVDLAEVIEEPDFSGSSEDR